MRASAFVSALLACLCSPMLPFPAAAAPFQQYKNADCTPGLCAIDFAVAPTGRRLELYDVSCYLRMKGAHQLIGMGLFIVDAGEHLVTLAPETVVGGAASEQTVYTANHSILAYAREGRRVVAQVYHSKGVAEQFACHISGEMLDAPVPPNLR